MREQAASAIETQHMPDTAYQARKWMNQQEEAARKNARMIDKINLALPRELSHDQNLALVRDYLAKLTDGRVPYAFAIHDKHGNDKENPHAHIAVRDTDVETGKRFLRFSDSRRDREKAGLAPCPVEHVRLLWEETANRHLELAGCAERIDRRTLEAQKIDRVPTIHEGPRAQALEQKGERADSQVRPAEAFGQARSVDYAEIDQGRTRGERNREIEAANAARTAEDEKRQAEAAEKAQQQQQQAAAARREAQAQKRALEQALGEKIRKEQAEFARAQRELRAAEEAARMKTANDDEGRQSANDNDRRSWEPNYRGVIEAREDPEIQHQVEEQLAQEDQPEQVQAPAPEPVPDRDPALAARRAAVEMVKNAQQAQPFLAVEPPSPERVDQAEQSRSQIEAAMAREAGQRAATTERLTRDGASPDFQRSAETGREQDSTRSDRQRDADAQADRLREQFEKERERERENEREGPER